jgi:hypothetical protein
MGWEHSCLGYPVSDTRNVNGRLEGLFEHGRIFMEGIDPIAQCQPQQPEEQRCRDGSTPSNGLCQGRDRILLQGQPAGPGGTSNRLYVVSNYGVLIGQGNLVELKNPSESIFATVKLIKRGFTNNDCGNANAVLVLSPGSSTSASNVYGTYTAFPINIGACLVWDVTRGGYPPPDSILLDVTFTYPLRR